MTLGTDTAALLLRSVDALMNLIEPAPYALLTPDERRSALRQLLVTTESAAKLAELAHADVPMPQCTLGGVPPAAADTTATTSGTMEAESPNPGNDVSEMVKGLETLRVELDFVWRGWLAGMGQPQRPLLEMETFLSDYGRTKNRARRLVKLMKAVEAEVESVGEHLEGSGRETETLQVELDGVKSEKVAAELHIAWMMAQLHKVRIQYVEAEEDDCRPNVDAERLMGKVKAFEKEVGSYMVKKEKMKAEEERVENALGRSMQETERLRIELDRARCKKANIEAEVEGFKVEAERVKRGMMIQQAVNG
ncbi:hypothetical protein DFP73DRAFT_567228 [Morchella snyderi]|nr:hypothetical protein DFP73DRAFT_567228 [Morchella snyderi]